MKKNTKVVGLHSYTTFWMRRISDASTIDLANKINDKKISVADWLVLLSIYRDDKITGSDLARFIGVDRAATKRTLDYLKKIGLIVRNSDADGRKKPIELTAKALKLIPEVSRLAEKQEQDVLSALSATEQKQLVKIMGKLAVVSGSPNRATK